MPPKKVKHPDGAAGAQAAKAPRKDEEKQIRAKLKALMVDDGRADMLVSTGGYKAWGFFINTGKVIVTKDDLKAYLNSAEAGLFLAHLQERAGGAAAAAAGGAAAAAAGAAPAAAAAAAAVWVKAEDAEKFIKELLAKRPVKDTKTDLEMLRMDTLLYHTLNFPADGDGKVLLFFRKTIKKLTSTIIGDSKRLAQIIGTPGIGKSTALFCILRELLKKGVKTVLFEAQQKGFVYKFTKVATGVEAHSMELEYWKPIRCPHATDMDAWRLIDPGGAGAPAVFTDDTVARTVIARSPGKGHVVEFGRKLQGCPEWYTPVWDYDELHLASMHNTKFHMEEFEDRFRLYGGVPRKVWDSVQPRHMRDIDNALQFTLSEPIVESAVTTGKYLLTHEKKVLHALFKMTPTDDAQAYTIEPISSKAVEAISNTFWDKLEDTVKHCCINNAACVGWAFEAVAHKWLQKGGTFRCDDGNKTLPKTTRCVVHGNLEEFAEQYRDALGTKIYQEPSRPNLPMIDSGYPLRNWTFQMKISDKMGKIDVEKLNTFRGALKKKFTYCWVVPNCNKDFKVDSNHALPPLVEQKILYLKPLTKKKAKVKAKAGGKPKKKQKKPGAGGKQKKKMMMMKKKH
eukprot:TRINITY_DN18294_c0_g1_i1.p1 TRINITY_DN18294_c0_g1~~TRINITY_DN18294_c0_g1_i1.p1  ORF type:complete len:645 (+),score=256.92 TRINITY_DN18294_c0_g1_i1:66-1937(+)